MNYEPVEFPSQGATLRGRLYGLNGLRPLPCLIMAHGTSATITMVADKYAEAFAAAGLCVLLYDHRNFGQSGGEPRQEINPWIQARGYADAVAFMRADDRIDSGRIALWGDSYSGMLVLVAGAVIGGIAAVVAQIPACGAELPQIEPGPEAFATLDRIFHEGDVDGEIVARAGPMPVVAADQIGRPSLLAPIQAFRWFMEYGGRHGSHWENRATRVTPRTKVPFSPWLTAGHLEAPVLMMVGRDDEMVHCNRAVQQAVFDRIASPKVFYEIDGGHFGLLWEPGHLFDEAVREQTAFLRKALHL